MLGAIWGGVAVKQAADAAEQEAYLACMAEQGYFPNDPSIDTEEELDAVLDASAAC